MSLRRKRIDGKELSALALSAGLLLGACRSAQRAPSAPSNEGVSDAELAQETNRETDPELSPPEPVTPTDPWQGSAIHSTDSNAGTYRVEYRTRPEPIPLNAPFEIDVRVSADSPAAMDDLSLDVDGYMPDHLHGMSRRPAVEDLGQGRFSVNGMLFHMPGDWQLFFDFSHGAATERAQFDVVLD